MRAVPIQRAQTSIDSRPGMQVERGLNSSYVACHVFVTTIICTNRVRQMATHLGNSPFDTGAMLHTQSTLLPDRARNTLEETLIWINSDYSAWRVLGKGVSHCYGEYYDFSHNSHRVPRIDFRALGTPCRAPEAAGRGPSL